MHGEAYKFKAIDEPDHLYLALSDGTIMETTDGAPQLEGGVRAVKRLLPVAARAWRSAGPDGWAADPLLVRVSAATSSYLAADATSSRTSWRVTRAGTSW